MAKGLKRHADVASLVKTLVLFDGPQVALLKSSRNLDMLAVACTKPGYVYPFFCVEVSPKTLRRYLEQRIDLNYVFRLKEAHKQFYFFDWSNLDGMSVPLKRALISDMQDPDLYPEPGFFARNHTVEFTFEHIVPSAVRTFEIDGKWDAPDFSRFYAKIADVYAFAVINAKSIRKHLSDLDIATLKNAISDYVWKGGGSYVSFYSNLFETVRSLNPLDVAKIQYASPGTIEITGGAEALDEVTAVLKRYDEVGRSLADIYRSIEKLLEREKIRGGDKTASFSSSAVEKYAMELATNFATKLGVEEPSVLLNFCSDNPVIFIKIVMSYYRRGRDLAKFQAEGRVQQSEIAGNQNN
jgi:hypothetical protein